MEDSAVVIDAIREPPAADATAARASRRLRIAVVAACPFPLARGTPARILRTAEALADRGHDVHVVTYHLGDAPLPAKLTVHRIGKLPTYRRMAPGPSYQKLLLVDTLLAVRLARLLRSYDFNIIHAHHFEGLAVARAARGGQRIPIVYDAHTTLAEELPYYALGLTQVVKRRMGRLIDRHLPRVADGVIAVSDQIHATLSQGLSRSVPMAVVPNGVEFAHFARNGPAAAQSDRLIYTGNLGAYQRIDLMLESFRRVLERRPHARLSIVLNEPRGELDAVAERLGISHAIEITRTSFEDLPPLLADAPIALNPRTDCPGMPQKVLNYMASGRAIVTFAGAAKHLRHGDTALIVPNHDVAAFADAIVSLIDDPALAQGLGAAAQAEAQRRFSWERSATRIEALYGRTLNAFAAGSRGVAGRQAAA